MDDILINLGKQIKSVRKDKNLSLRQVAKMSGVSIGLISKIENYRTTPSLPVLFRIMKSLEIDLSELDLNKPKEKNYILIRNGEGEIEEREDSSGLEYTFLFTHYIPESHLRTYLIKIKNDVYRKPVSGDTFEMAHVLYGKVDYILNNEIITLNEGDTIFYDGLLPLGWNTKYDTDAKLLKMYMIKKS